MDTLSPYVFVLCAEILSHVLREVGDIRGIVVHDVEFKVSLKTEDTTMFVDEDLNSVVNIPGF